MASLAELNQHFAIPGVLAFDEPHPGLVRAFITTPACSAEIFLYGAHLTQWQPTKSGPVLFLSPNSAFEPGKPIRGGVPVIFPWFGARTPEITGNTTEGPMHGFARTSQWEVAFAGQSGDDVHLTLHLPITPEARAAGFDNVRCAMEFTFGRTLTMRMAVANDRSEPVVFEQALHSYFRVADASQVRIHGLAHTEFLDKVDGFKRKTQQDPVITFTAETDRPYLNTTATVHLDDPGMQRRLAIAKTGSKTTVVWNPNEERSIKLADLGAGQWHHFACVETANAAENRVTLAPRCAHVMESRISVEPLPAHA